MSRIERNWQYAEQFPEETDAQVRARRLSLELGIEPVSRSVAAAISATAAATDATNMCEIGTGVGVSGLSLLRYRPNATLTSIDVEAEYLREAKGLFAEAGVASSRLRLVEGDARHVVPRLNPSAYDMVLVHAGPTDLLEHVENAVTVVRPGGTILVPDAFAGGNVAEPSARDEGTQRMRDLLHFASDAPGLAVSLSASGDGLLMLVRIDPKDDA